MSFATIKSLATNLLPNVLNSQQLDELIGELLQIQHSMATNNHNNNNRNNHLETNTSEQCVDLDDEVLARRQRHARNERARHQRIVELIDQLSQMIGGPGIPRAQILDRSARYVLFLEHVIDKLEADRMDDSVMSEEWLQSLYPLYQRACEEAESLLQTSGGVSAAQTCDQSFNDQCLPLRS